MNHRRPATTHWLLACLVLVLVADVGCFRNSNSASRPKKSPDREVSDVVQDDENETNRSSDAEMADEAADGKTTSNEAAKSEESTEDPNEANTAGASDQDYANSAVSAGVQADSSNSETAIDETEEAAAVPLERLLLLTTGGPLVIDVQIAIDGESHEAALARLVEEALSAADEDGDGRPTWDEVANSERFQYGQFSNLEIDSDSDRQQLIRMYDRDRDDVVDREELPRFLTRNVGRSQSFSLRSSNEYRDDNRSRSAIRRLLDDDRNGAITEEELAQSRSRLLQFDANDDEILTPAEIDDDAAQMARQLSRSKYNRSVHKCCQKKR